MSEKNNTEFNELYLELQDNQWPFTYTDHDRHIARAIVYDDDGLFYFVHVERHDQFADGSFIESSGGGVDPGETPEAAVLRELKEELGAEAEIVCKIGVVSDYYNLIHRHNINNYYLCRILSFGQNHLTEEEARDFKLSTSRLSLQDAVREYESQAAAPWGALVSARELPVLKRAAEILNSIRA